MDKEILEWCGFKYYLDWGWAKGNILDDSYAEWGSYPLDMKFFLRYAVPKLKRWRIANYPSGNMSETGLIRAFVATADWTGMAENPDSNLAWKEALIKLIRNKDGHS